MATMTTLQYPDPPVVLDRREGPFGEVVLRRHGDLLQIIANGTFLMDTSDGRSERRLVDAALDALDDRERRTWELMQGLEDFVQRPDDRIDGGFPILTLEPGDVASRAERPALPAQHDDADVAAGRDGAHNCQEGGCCCSIYGVEH